jgi:hypothetical protein
MRVSALDLRESALKNTFSGVSFSNQQLILKERCELHLEYQ